MNVRQVGNSNPIPCRTEPRFEFVKVLATLQSHKFFPEYCCFISNFGANVTVAAGCFVVNI